MIIKGIRFREEALSVSTEQLYNLDIPRLKTVFSISFPPLLLIIVYFTINQSSSVAIHSFKANLYLLTKSKS